MDSGRPEVSPALWEAICQQVVGPIAVADLQARHVAVNPAMCRMLGYSREELMQLRPVDVTHPEDEVIDPPTIERLLAEGVENFPAEKRLLHADGRVIWVLIDSSIVRGEDGTPQFFVSQFHDITARRESEQLWRRTLANAPIGMALLDLDGRWTEANERLCDMLGYAREELLGQSLTDMLYETDVERVRTALADLRAERQESGSLEVRFRYRDGEPFWMLVRLSVVPGADDRPTYLVSQYEPVGGGARFGEHRMAELARMALHDPLTGLANRALLVDRLDKEIAALAERDGVVVVLMVDLDELKPVNDRLGHAAGDELIQAAAHELQSAVRIEDTVARIGGDEFVVVSSAPAESEAEGLRERVERRLDTEVVTSNQRIALRASVGLATTGSTGTTAQMVLHEADQDMYARKAPRPRDEPRYAAD
jgi:diguanylate cyclase (GGDEF)-like protein/PAS domain S-box-containing protein